MLTLGSRTTFLTTITLMDEDQDTVLLTICSNSKAEADTLDQLCKVGSVPDLIQPSVVRPTGRPGEVSDPITTCKFGLKFVGGRSQVRLITGPGANFLEQLVTIPLLAAGVDYIALQEVRERNRRGQYCTVLAAVQCCKDEVTINGRVVREIRLLDDDTDTAVLKLWESEQRRVTETWVSPGDSDPPHQCPHRVRPISRH